MSLSGIFKSVAQWNQERIQKSDLIRAIKNKDAIEVTHQIETGDKNVLLKNFSKLIKTALATDDAKVFDAVFKLHPDPNYRFRTSSADRWGSFELETTLLYQAILDGKKNVALQLARLPGLDVYASGGFFKSMGLPGANTVFPNAFQFAKKQGMDDVAAILGHRSGLDLKRQP